MKANLQCGSDIRNGYVNVNHGPIQLDEMAENTKIVMGDFRNLDPIFEDNTLEEIIFNPPLNIISPGQLPETIKHWHKKLATGGILKSYIIDVRKVGKAAHVGTIGLQDIHNLILGANYEYKTVIDTVLIENLFSKLGYQTNSVNTIEFLSILEVAKNAENNM